MGFSARLGFDLELRLVIVSLLSVDIFLFYSDSPYFEQINEGIMELHDDGIVDSIREKWIRYSERNCERVSSFKQTV